jgi:hypothetical protein
MGAWIAQTAIGATPTDVLAALTNPDAIMDWSPVDFEVDGLRGNRLETGSNAIVGGRLGGKSLHFDVRVDEASNGRLALTATHDSLELEVEYLIEDLDEMAQVTASVEVTGKGVLGRFVAKAVEGLLAGGSLDSALGRIANQIESNSSAGLALAA